MKTLTIKTAQNVPAYASYNIYVDEEKIGTLKPSSTAYFEIEDDAKSIIAKMQGSKTETLDISENRHHLLIIDCKKQLIHGYILTGIFLIVSLSMTFFLKSDLEFNFLINLGIFGLLYFIYKKTSFNGIKISIAEN